MKTAGIILGGLLTTLLMMGACFYVIGEHPTVITLSEGPSFDMTGNGQLASFTVYAPRTGNRIAFAHKDDSTVVWQIVATRGYFKGTRVGGLVIRYGTVPPGYSQLVPNEHLSPALSAGVAYSFFAETTNAPGAGGYFYIDEKGPVLTVIPDLCLTLKNGRNVRVKCSFDGDRTYQEAANLAEVMHKYEIRNTSEAEKFYEAEFCKPDQSKSK